MVRVAVTGHPRQGNRQRQRGPLHYSHADMAGMLEELMMAEGGIADLMQYTASWPVLVTARHRIRRKLGQPHLVNDGELRHLQRLLRQGRFRHDCAGWKDSGHPGKPFVRQADWEQIVGYALFWTLSAAWVPVRHGSVFGSAPGSPTGSDGPYAFANRRGVLDAVAAVKAHLPRPTGPRDGFVVAADGSHTFERLRHDMVLKRLENRINDQLALDLLADLLTSVQTADGVGVGRGGPMANLLGDVAFSHVDWNWPEMGVRHRMQHCYLHPWRNQRHHTAYGDQLPPAPAWFLDLFAPVLSHHDSIWSQNRLQAAPDGPGDQLIQHLPHHRAEDSSLMLLTQPRTLRPGARSEMADGSVYHVDPWNTVNRDAEETSLYADILSTNGDTTMCPTIDLTRSGTRFCGSGPPSSTLFMRYVDDCLVAGEGGPRRALWSQEAICQQYGDLGVPLNPRKCTVGSLYDGFDFLGIRWKFSRVSGALELTVSPGRQADIVQEVRSGIWKTFRQNPRDRLAVVQAVKQTLVRRTQYLRQAGADDREVWAAGHDQLLRLARWYDWPLDERTTR